MTPRDSDVVFYTILSIFAASYGLVKNKTLYKKNYISGYTYNTVLLHENSYEPIYGEWWLKNSADRMGGMPLSSKYKWVEQK